MLFAACSLMGLGAQELQAQARGVQLGPITAYPTLGVKGLYTDNLTLTPSNEISTYGVVISPGIRLEATDDINTYTLLYRAEGGEYDDSPIDDYRDHEVSAGYSYQRTDRLRIDLNGSYLNEHDPRGTGAQQGIVGGAALKPDRWHAGDFDGLVSYGAAGAKGRFDLQGGYFSKRYENNPQITDQRNRDDADIGGAFFWRIQPKTSLLVKLAYTDVDYESADLDSTQIGFFAGVTWEALAKTTGRAQIGASRKEFDSPGRDNSDDLAWLVGVEWRPRTYSIVKLSTTREQNEADGLSGDFILRTAADVAWTHDWRPRFSTTLNFSYAREEHEPTPRDDDVFEVGAHLTYQARRWLSISGGYAYSERDSSLPNQFSFTQNEFFVSLGAAL